MVGALVGAFLVPVAGAVDSPPAHASSGPTLVPAANITTDTTWTAANSPYIVSNRPTVTAKLTIEPGTVVKFVTNPAATVNLTGLNIQGGQLVAVGTASAPITFTSALDDSVGGDSNGDGGATQPARGDWLGLAFTASNQSQALAMPESIVDRAVFKYGADGGGGICGSGSEINVSQYGRVAISHSDFTEALGSGVVFQLQPTTGVGIATLTTSRFSSSHCGITAVSGNVAENIVESTVDGKGAAIGSPQSLRFTGNWIYPSISFNGAVPRSAGDLRDNALIGGADVQPNGQNPLDLSDNWWGHVLEVPYPSGCWDGTKTYIPAVTHTGSSGACPSIITGYFTKVLPALTSAPLKPEAGSGAAAGATGPVAIPSAQTYGGAGGSDFAARPTGDQADPVNSASGSYVTSSVDALLPTSGSVLAAARTYTSADDSTGSLGRGWSFGYDTRVTRSADTVTLRTSDGQQVTYLSQADGSYLGDPGSAATLAESPDGTLAAITRDGTRYEFNLAGQVSRIADRVGRVVTFAYSDSGLLQTATSGSRALNFDWNAAGDRLASVTLPDGRHADYGYSDGLLTTVTDLAGKTTTYGYDGSGRLTSVTRPSGIVSTRLAYDATTGRVSDQWDGRNDHTTFAWDAASGTATMTDPRGGVWKDIYKGNVITKRIDPRGATTTYEYDANLHLIAFTNEKGIRSVFGFTGGGDIVSFQGNGPAVTMAYNTDHLPVSSVDGRGTKVTYTYNSVGELSTITRPDPSGGADQVTTYGYDSDGRMTSKIDARGKRTNYGYNSAGELTSVTSPEGGTTSFGYDASSRRISVTEPRGNVSGADAAAYTTTYRYDDDDRLTTSTDPLGHATSVSYNADGDVASITGPKSDETSYTYDPDRHVTAIQGPDTSIPATAKTYDANGNVLSVTDPAGMTLSYTYNLTNLPITKTTPLGTRSMAYDLSGNVTTVTEPTGAKTQMSYDASNRLVSIDYPNSASDASFTYDADGNRLKMTDASGSTTYTYDALNQLTKATRGTSSFTFGYDREGNQTSLTYPDGTAFAYSYDADGRLTTAASGTSALATYQYDAAGEQVSAALSDGSTSTRTYDAVGQLTHVDDELGSTTLLDESYAYDANGSPTAVSRADGSTDVYQYDKLNRLTDVCYNATSCTGPSDFIAWTYGPTGNILTETRPSGTASNTYNSKGQLTQSAGPSGTVAYAYDALGRRTAAGGTTATYDDAGRTKTVTVGGATTSYAYDGDGRRISASVGTSATNYLFEPNSGTIALERDAQGNLLRRYGYGTGLTALTLPGGAYVSHPDRMGSLRVLTSSAGAVQYTASYEPYGRLRASSSAAGAPADPIGWQGLYLDTTGEYHAGARQYDPAAGAFTSPDPASAVPASATYTYGLANPMLYTDPSGLAAQNTPGAMALARATYDFTGIFAMRDPLWAFLHASVAASIADMSCNAGKGSCGGDIVNAALDTAVLIPIPRPGEAGEAALGVARSATAIGRLIKTSRELGEAEGGAARFVTTGRGVTYDIPKGYVSRPADSNKGIIFQPAGQESNRLSIRIMEPTDRYPSGYSRYYNGEGGGQPLNPATGAPGTADETHVPADYLGRYIGWPQ